MCFGIYKVMVSGKLAKNATMDPVPFFGISTKNHHLDSHAGVDMSRPGKKDYASTGR